MSDFMTQYEAVHVHRNPETHELHDAEFQNLENFIPDNSEIVMTNSSARLPRCPTQSTPPPRRPHALRGWF